MIVILRQPTYIRVVRMDTRMDITVDHMLGVINRLVLSRREDRHILLPRKVLN